MTNLETEYSKNSNGIKYLKRCTKCVLPETFPFIEFDEEGVCNYCRNHKPMKVSSSFDNLIKLVEPYRRNNKIDCIVPFSGGRDSTLALHIIKKELKLNPVAFTYDWGMATDLAYRNADKVCKKLGVENITVKANIARKRENIRKNITAWLKNPELGMIPLFMAGDKWFFYYCNQLKKDLDVKLNIWGVNRLENTDFKTGFAGLRPEFEKKTIYSINLQNQLKLFGYVTKNVLKSPGYINNSIFDSLGSFASRYISPKKDYFHLFDYYKWDENELNDLLINEYDYELAPDSPSTWRIGDGTAAFYNYIYYTVAGFSEYDTFRSNQIREGMISREEAIKLLEKENFPRFESIKWYLDTINLDYDNVMKIINNIPKLY
ncbi:MAG: 7-cyano-7-deazaguanine synthase [Bacilli bacterium]